MSVATLSDIGVCEKCQGHLCMSGRLVRCESCGHIHPEHPFAVANAVKAPPPPAHDIPPMEYASTLPDRVMILERTVQAMDKRLKAQEARLKHLEKELGAVGAGR